jgi:hypothetical protein
MKSESTELSAFKSGGHEVSRPHHSTLIPQSTFGDDSNDDDEEEEEEEECQYFFLH